MTFKSNSRKASLEKTCKIEGDNKIIDCWLITEDNCKLHFYYKNQIEDLVLINKTPIIIGNGIPNHSQYLLYTYSLFGLLYLMMI